MTDSGNVFCVLRIIKSLENKTSKHFFSMVWIRKTSCRYSGSFTVASMCCGPGRKLREPQLHLLFLTVWAQGQRQGFNGSRRWSDASDNYLQLCHFLFHSLALLVSTVVAAAAVCRFTSGSSSFCSGTLQSDVTRWRLRWQPGRQGHTVTYFLTKDMKSSFWQAPRRACVSCTLARRSCSISQTGAFSRACAISEAIIY